MPQISIIITAYNAEKTIERCLNSILDTKYNDYEIILINDGSTDNTEEVIQLFATDKIKYFTKPNSGVADSRNFGIEKASGDYITFVDSDDYVASNYFENVDKYMAQDVDLIKRKGIIINNKVNNKASIEDCQINNEDKGKNEENSKAQNIIVESEKIEKIEGATFEITTGEDAFNKLCFTDKYLDTLWSYIIKRSLFTDNNFKFETGRYHEDFGLLPLIILKANKVVSTNDYVYYYVQSENSIMREQNLSKTIKKAKDALYHYDNILSTIENYNLSQFTKENVKIYCTNAILLKVSEFEVNVNESKIQHKDINDTSKSTEKKLINEGLQKNYNDNEQDIEDKLESESKNEQYLKAQKWYLDELKKRKIYKNIKARNLKQLIKKVLLFINIKIYLKFS